MTLSRFSLALTLVGVLTAVPAAAQIAPGRSGSSSMRYFGGQEAWDTLRDFGTCYAGRQRADALELVATRPDTLDEAKVYKRLFSKQNQSCLSLATELRMPYQIVRGAIAEGLYRRAVPVPAALAVTQPPSVNQVRNFMDAALCYSTTHRTEVRNLLATTRLGTKAEDQQVSTIMSDLERCIPPNARSISISTPMVRVRLAEAMWRLGETPERHAQ